ncbi:hypothetical protein [Burkholderia cepacia]|uniref:hypothetical protein n=1 Tax=Burkholderia cepacia TaxID=292 RepID=UPI000A802754|nr:hypothetical protein [Burkholderia cepacia]
MAKREIERPDDAPSPDAKSCPIDIGELTILLDPRLGGASYFGTRAQIEAEGIGIVLRRRMRLTRFCGS